MVSAGKWTEKNQVIMVGIITEKIQASVNIKLQQALGIQLLENGRYGLAFMA